MTLEIQFKLKNNPNYIRYIRNHSYWYKLLNRDPNLFAKFEEEVKTAYKLRTSDRISSALEAVSLIQNVIASLK